MRDVYQEVTDRIAAALEKGVAPWVRPWTAAGAPRNVGGREYNGVNVILLEMEAAERGFASPIWMTYKQAAERGGHVRRGERGTTVVFWKVSDLEDEKGRPVIGNDGEQRRSFYLRHFTVFNLDQTEGVSVPAEAVPAVVNEEDRDRAADAFARATGASVKHGGSKASYSKEQDVVRMPAWEAFRGAADYYSTLLHELVHWTGHDSRLARDLSGRFGSGSYAMEELVAELGAAFLCARLRIDGTLQHAEYLATWAKKLREDKRAIFSVAGTAKKAAEFLAAFSGSETADEREEAVA